MMFPVNNGCTIPKICLDSKEGFCWYKSFLLIHRIKVLTSAGTNKNDESGQPKSKILNRAKT
ncbi:MAG: hypothetical protein AMJ65_04935 [Phycisphaerae bacterium SG8_4]|nr:MAG: hypothetical protein AMJ65_04935 [Phycisphaerae bacterium SG8_4]